MKKEPNTDPLQSLIGMKTWGCKQGYGNFITLELSPEGAERNIDERGTWHIWITDPWRISKSGMILVGSEDDLDPVHFNALNGHTLLEIDIPDPAFGARFVFENEFSLEMFVASTSRDMASIMMMSDTITYFLNGSGHLESEPTHGYEE